MGRTPFLVLAALLGLYLLPPPAVAACQLKKAAEFPVTMTGMRAIIPAKINGVDASLAIDSGAFFSMLKQSSVAKFKLTPVTTALMAVEGVTGSASVTAGNAADFDMGGVHLKKVDFLIVPTGAPGPDADGLLGQNILGITDTEYDFANGAVRMFYADGCGGAVLAYWDQSQPYSVVDLEPTTLGESHVIGSGKVNGVNIRIVFDTGAPRSILTTGAAARAGVKSGAPGVTWAGYSGGIGRRSVESWIGPFSSFSVGDEAVKNTRLRFGAIQLDHADMLLGADFFLSHRIYVSKSQHKLYFTYNGGPVFNLAQAADAEPGNEPPAAQAPPASAAPTASAAADEGGQVPQDAAGFARRGAAYAARRDFSHAIADLGRAVDLDPANPAYPYQRAVAEIAVHQTKPAMADLDRALKLKPDDSKALMERGRLRLTEKDEPGAKADFDAAARIDPTLGLQIANTYTYGGAFEDAIATYDAWIGAHPKDPGRPTWLNDRCWSRALWGQELDRALIDCDAAIKASPRVPAYRDSRGLVHLRLGQFDDAIADYDAVLKAQPKLAWSLYGRGLAKLRLGKTADGQADINAAIALEPKLPDEAKRFGVAP